jgi:hypothetical protein
MELRSGRFREQNVASLKKTSANANHPRSKRSSQSTSIVGKPLNNFPAGKLPQNRLVLRRFCSLRLDHPKMPKSEVAGILYGELMELWLPSRVPTKKKLNCIIQLSKLIDSYTNV